VINNRNQLKKRHKQQVNMLKIKPRSDFMKATASFAGAFLLLIIWALFKGYASLFILLAAVPVSFYLFRTDIVHPEIHVHTDEQGSTSVIEIEVLEHPVLVQGSFLRYAVNVKKQPVTLEKRSVWALGHGKDRGRSSIRISAIDVEGVKRKLWEGCPNETSSPLFV
jgi:hypothetical protein